MLHLVVPSSTVSARGRARAEQQLAAAGSCQVHLSSPGATRAPADAILAATENVSSKINRNMNYFCMVFKLMLMHGYFAITQK